MNRAEILEISKPILFNTDMVKAVMAGRKSVTRRVVKPKYSNTHFEFRTDKYGTKFIELQNNIESETFFVENGRRHQKLLAAVEVKFPYQIGDYLYVRETHYTPCNKNECSEYGNCQEGCSNLDVFYYKADNKCVGCMQGTCLPTGVEKHITCELCESRSGVIKWRPPIYMPKSASRIFLRVTNVRVERLWYITYNNVINEGIYECANGDNCNNCDVCNVIDSFANLWNSTIKKSDLDQYGWNANPWVWVIEFERVNVNE